jgi:hypothetical protein
MDRILAPGEFLQPLRDINAVFEPVGSRLADGGSNEREEALDSGQGWRL